MLNLRKIRENSFIADVEHYESIPSTNDRAIAAAGEPGARLPLLIVTDAQTAGRGRGSNRWWTGQGSLAFSLLMQTVGWDKRVSTSAGPQSTLISLAIGVALIDALAPLVPGHEIGIHWPNDVILDGRKLAGVLVEVMSGGQVVIGVGINTDNTAADAPVEVRPRVATLFDANGRKHDATALLIAVLNDLEKRIAELASAPEQITARTHELCLQRGTKLQVCRSRQVIQGVCQGIAADGALVLEVDGQSQAIYSGTVTSV
jgi:BirA family biotin operon repressor/biotin-[acetyl-CoA-carboxylase] ligase